MNKTKVDQIGPKWTKVDGIGPKWTESDENGLNRTTVDLIKMNGIE